MAEAHQNRALSGVQREGRGGWGCTMGQNHVILKHQEFTGPVLSSGFLVDLAHSERVAEAQQNRVKFGVQREGRGGWR